MTSRERSQGKCPLETKVDHGSIKEVLNRKRKNTEVQLMLFDRFSHAVNNMIRLAGLEDGIFRVNKESEKLFLEKNMDSYNSDSAELMGPYYEGIKGEEKYQILTKCQIENGTRKYGAYLVKMSGEKCFIFDPNTKEWEEDNDVKQLFGRG